MRLVGVLALAALLGFAHGWTHGWGSVNEAGYGDMGSFQPWINLTSTSSQYWDRIAELYAVVVLNGVSQRWNGTVDSERVQAARLLKARKPSIKVMFYYAASWVSQDAPVQAEIRSHPEWWLRDDHGNPVMSGPGYVIDWSVKEAADFWIGLPQGEFKDPSEMKGLIDGVFCDGSGAMNLDSANISASRWSTLLDAKLDMLSRASAFWQGLNGGEVHGNPLIEYGDIGRKPPSDPTVSWNYTLSHYNGAFDEMFGSFGTQNPDGTWNVSKMELSFESIINATRANKTVAIHAFPGPATVPFTSVNGVAIASWAGPVRRPTTMPGVQQAAKDRLVESLAPYLIVASERTFFGYAWFYNIESGYIPCPPPHEDDCAAPPDWYEDMSRPLGPPKGPAVRAGTVWTREFEHASVYVDLKDRSASKIQWS